MVFLLVIAILTNGSFAYNVRQVESPEACLAAGPKAKADVEKHVDVKVAAWSCFGVDPTAQKS